MRTVHYNTCSPHVTAFEITDDFGNEIVFEDFSWLCRRLPVDWMAAMHFLATGREAR